MKRPPDFNLAVGVMIATLLALVGVFHVFRSHAATNNADFNNDGTVNITDLSILATHWNQTGLSQAQGDANGDGAANITDLSILATQWGTNPTSTCTGVNVAVGTLTKALVSSYPTGTTFCLAAGTFNLATSIQAPSNDKFIGASRTQTVLDFTNATLDTQNGVYYGLYGFGGSAGQQNVTVQNLTIQNCTSTSHTCHALKTGWNWSVSNIDVHASDLGYESGTGSVCDNCYLHDNLVYGFSGNGTIQNSEVALNGGTPDSGGSTGGSKSVQQVTLTWKNDYVHDNRGPAIWCDGCWSGSQILIDSNRIENNTGPGIDFEITWGNCSATSCIDGVASTGYAIAQNNTLNGNDTTDIGQSCFHSAQIQVQNSQGVAVTGNTIDSTNGANALCVIDTVRNDLFPTYPQCVSPFTASGNTFILPNATALIGEVGDDSAAGCPNYTSQDISFQNNSYKLDSLTAGHWAWHTMGNSSSWTQAQWQSVGEDTASTFALYP